MMKKAALLGCALALLVCGASAQEATYTPAAAAYQGLAPFKPTSVAINGCTIGSAFECAVPSAAQTTATDLNQASGGTTLLPFASTSGISVGQTATGTNIPQGDFVASIVSTAQVTLTANGVSNSGQKVVTTTATAGSAVGQQCKDTTTPGAIGDGNVIASIQAGVSITMTTNLTGNTANTDSIKCDPVVTLQTASSGTISSGASIAFLANATTVSSASAIFDQGDFSLVGNLNVGGVTLLGPTVTLGSSFSAPTWTTSGIKLIVAGGTLTDQTATGTTANVYNNNIGADTNTSSGTATYTTLSTLHIAQPNACIGVLTCTNRFALNADNATIGGTTVSTNGSVAIASAASLVMNSTTGAAIAAGATSSTVPVFCPNRNSGTTCTGGVGADAAGDVSLIGGSTEVDRITSGGHFFKTITTGTNQDVLCMASTGLAQIQAAASCTISDPALKTDKHVFTASVIPGLMQLKTWTFRFKDWKTNKDPNAEDIELGLMAPDIAKHVSLCAMFYDDHKGHLIRSHPKSYREECMIAVLVKAMQEQQIEIAALKRAVHGK